MRDCADCKKVDAYVLRNVQEKHRQTLDDHNNFLNQHIELIEKYNKQKLHSVLILVAALVVGIMIGRT